MIDELKFYVAEGTEPYVNIATEEYFLEHVKPGECILYLWQNRKTVVVGRNQNAWGECNTEALERDGGFLARRLSGGGAVFHDLGNLNFTFITSKADFDVPMQTRVILNAVSKLGIHAELTGRNDLTIDGKKFSGHAYYKTDKACYHHGTLLVHADKELMSRYLNVSEAKLQAKGVKSVRSRVTNLQEFIPDLLPLQLIPVLVEAFQETYGLPVSEYSPADLDEERIKERSGFFASREWKYGKHAPFTWESRKRFSWGELHLQLQIEKGMIKDANIFSDAMDPEIGARLRRELIGTEFDEASLTQKFH